VRKKPTIEKGGRRVKAAYRGKDALDGTPGSLEKKKKGPSFSGRGEGSWIKPFMNGG